METKKEFKVIKNDFGGIDERATTESFEFFVGGVKRAQRLQYIWSNLYVTGPPHIDLREKKITMFKIRAGHEGFTKEQAEAFLML